MRQQKGYLFHSGKSWFLRYCDTDRQTGKRIQVCEKLKVEYGGAYRTKASVKDIVKEILKPLNEGKLNPQSTMSVVEFIDTIYLPDYIEKHLRPASLKQSRNTYQNHLKQRLGKLTLRSFRTLDGER